MHRPAVKTLVLPFERQNQIMPNEANRWLYLNAHPLEQPAPWREGLTCEQGFRSLYYDLQQDGFVVEPHLTDSTSSIGSFRGALILTHRSKELSREMVARAVANVGDSGNIIVAGEKTSGIAPLKKWVSQHAEITDAFSKFHAQAFIFAATRKAKEAFAAEKFDPNAGIYGGGKIDKGSALLASTFDETIQGDVADFCAGTGYLAQQIIQGSKPASLTLFEADHKSLELAKAEFSNAACPTTFHWLDLAREPVSDRYDWIVMNPPFHVGRAADASLGQAMIRAARSALKPNGKLRLVANRQLPYEQTLKELFGTFRELTVADGFKVLQA